MAHLAVTERLDALQAFIAARTQARAVRVRACTPLSGGAIQENYRLQVHLQGGTHPGERVFVLRCDAPATLPFSLGRSQEFQVLAAAAQAGVQVPRPLWACEDPTRIGAAFYLMQWVPGVASGRALVRDDALTTLQRRQLMAALGANLARLHQIRPAAGRLPFLPPPEGNPAQRRIAQYRQALARSEAACPALELALQVLAAHVPPAPEWVLCHGDFRTGNYLVHEGRLAAILDWEFAGWSDPHEDLGWMCARSWRFGRLEREAGGVGDRADLLAGYERVAGRPVDALKVAYWEVMASVRWALIAQAQAWRHRSGRQPSLELALTGRMLPEIQQDLMAHLRRLVRVLARQGIDGAQPPDLPTLSPSEPLAPSDRAPGAKQQSAQGLGDPPDREPDSVELLHAARDLLLGEVLANAPKAQHYALRMIASAIGMAGREVALGSDVANAQRQCIHRFYRQQGREAAGSSVALLARDIREGRFDRAQWQPLFALLDEVLDQQLRLSNPRRCKQA